MSCTAFNVDIFHNKSQCIFEPIDQQNGSNPTIGLCCELHADEVNVPCARRSEDTRCSQGLEQRTFSNTLGYWQQLKCQETCRQRKTQTVVSIVNFETGKSPGLTGFYEYRWRSPSMLQNLSFSSCSSAFRHFVRFKLNYSWKYDVNIYGLLRRNCLLCSNPEATAESSTSHFLHEMFFFSPRQDISKVQRIVTASKSPVNIGVTRGEDGAVKACQMEKVSL